MQHLMRKSILVLFAVCLSVHLTACDGDAPPAHERLDAIEKRLNADQQSNGSVGQASAKVLRSLSGQTGLSAEQLEKLSTSSHQMTSKVIDELRKCKYHRSPNGDDVYTISKEMQIVVSGSTDEPRLSGHISGYGDVFVLTLSTQGIDTTMLFDLGKMSAAQTRASRVSLNGHGTAKITVAANEHGRAKTTLHVPEGASLYHDGEGFEIGKREQALIIDDTADGASIAVIDLPALTIARPARGDKLVVPAWRGTLGIVAGDASGPRFDLTDFNIDGPIEVSNAFKTQRFEIKRDARANVTAIDPALVESIKAIFGG